MPEEAPWCRACDEAIVGHQLGPTFSRDTLPPTVSMRRCWGRPRLNFRTGRDPLRGPRGVRDEVLEGLIRARVVDARQHRAHRLPATVAQQPQHIPAERPPLRHVAERGLERLEPLNQSVQPRRRVERQQHRATTYQNVPDRTMSSNQITQVSLGKCTI